MTAFFSSLAYSCPLILCSLGALFSEFAGCLALFLDGLVSFSAFLFYTLHLQQARQQQALCLQALRPW